MSRYARKASVLFLMLVIYLSRHPACDVQDGYSPALATYRRLQTCYHSHSLPQHPTSTMVTQHSDLGADAHSRSSSDTESNLSTAETAVDSVHNARFPSSGNAHRNSLSTVDSTSQASPVSITSVVRPWLHDTGQASTRPSIHVIFPGIDISMA